ncbi:hypothetical protein AVEN_152593-1 [Araneus ventricosus]|uniref:Secreted protein n=1 Tax=Araneus ventricosus TaxID=182803 RepID=A0A4Y2FYQ4_ARAVE|nr:hypothetical protein AVEN_152593-1 [Araneus ventricosus]
MVNRKRTAILWISVSLLKIATNFVSLGTIKNYPPPCLDTRDELNDPAAANSKFGFCGQHTIAAIASSTNDDPSDRGKTRHRRWMHKRNITTVVSGNLLPYTAASHPHI